MDIQKAIQTVINTLNQIEIRGIRNMDYLLGAVRLLEQIKQETEVKEDAGDPA